MAPKKDIPVQACCNPFNDHTKRNKGLRPISRVFTDRYPSAGLRVGNKLCGMCRKRIIAQSTRNSPEAQDVAGPSTAVEDVEFEDDPVSTLNETLSPLGISPFKKQRLERSKHYAKGKVKRVGTAIKRKLETMEIEVGSTSSSDETAESEIVQQLKDAFHASTKKSSKIQILTILPKSWTRKTIVEKCGATDYMVRRAKELAREKGILATPNRKTSGRTLSDQTVVLVKEWYRSDEISRVMAGMKDFVSVKIGDTRMHVQKRLILCNLREVYASFKTKHGNAQIGFSKFADLRPKECVLAGASGTHSVCVCTVHQNVKLMWIGAKLNQLTLEDIPLKSYKHGLAQMTCNPPLLACHMGDCANCPQRSTFNEQLKVLMDSEMIDEVQYKQWVSTDRSTLETIVKKTDDFVDDLCDKLANLLRHDFIAKQQSNYQTDVKDNLQIGEFLVLLDFAENYAFVLQDAAQGFHWNNAQATIHPFVCYYRSDDTLKHISYVVISDCMKHDTVSVHLFQRNLVRFLKDRFDATPSKMIYFSDGAASQYKNRKNFEQQSLSSRGRF